LITVVENVPPIPVIPEDEFPKLRYISFTPGNSPGFQQAFRVTITSCPLFPEAEGIVKWVKPWEGTPPADGSLTADLECVEDPTNLPDWAYWSTTEMIYVGDKDIVPGYLSWDESEQEDAIYTVEATFDGVNFSAPVNISTHCKLGDIVGNRNTSHPYGWNPPDGIVGLADIMNLVGRFQGHPYVAPLPVCDLFGGDETPDRVVNLADMMQAIAGFQGTTYIYLVITQSHEGPQPC